MLLDLLTNLMGYVPVKVKTDPISPIINDRPCVGQFPSLRKVVKTSEASWCGPKIANGRRIAKKPKMCMIRMNPWKLGRNFPTTVFIMIVNTVKAQKNRTVCHGWGL